MTFPFPMVSPRTAAPFGGTMDLDFLNQIYTVSGVTKTAADVVDQPGVITADGLVLADSASVVSIIGDALTLLLASTAGLTVVLGWDNLDNTNNVIPLVLINPDTSDEGIQIKRQGSLSSYFMNATDFSGIHFRSTTDASAATGDNIHTIALTRTNTKLVFSVDGRAVVSAAGDPDDFTISPTTATFGGLPGDTMSAELRILSLQLYNPVDDSLLPSLSA
jgi:hypothetical protein